MNVLKKFSVMWLSMLIILTASFISVNAADAASEAALLGDIAVRNSGQTTFDTEHNTIWDAKPGDSLDLGLSLNTTQIKQQMQHYYDQAGSLVSAGGNAGAITLHETSCTFTSTISFPSSVDLSSVNAQAIKDANLTYYNPNTNTYNNTYTDTSHAVIDSNYSLDKCGKFNITNVVVDTATNKITIEMSLDVSKLNYTGDNPAGTYAYGHLVCLNAAVQNTPDYLTTIIPGIKIKQDYDGKLSTISGQVSGKFHSVAGGGSWWQFLGQKMDFTWNGTQDTEIYGDGTDANSNTSGITLSYKHENQTPTTPSSEAQNTPSSASTNAITKTQRKSISPLTNDSSNIGFYSILLVASTLLIGFFLKKKFYRTNRH